MSSILDALKKAEQESNTDRGGGTPWSASLPAQSPYRQSARRWWVPLGIVVVLCVSGAVFLKARRPDTTRPSASVKAAPPSHKTHDNARPSVAKNPKSNVPVAEKKQARPATTLIQETVPMAAAAPVRPVKEPPQATTSSSAPMVQSPPLPLEKTQRQVTVPKHEPVISPPEAPNRRPAETAVATGQPMTELLDSGKIFRSDPRIELQALVWASESAARFVVINNRLVKEGGFVDNIVVVQINQDDVLLSEGSDRWHEEFKVR